MTLTSTEEQALLQQLRESELSLKQSQEIAGMGSWEWNPITNLSRWSENIYALYEIKETNVQPSFEYVLSRLHPDDVAIMHNAHAWMSKTKSQVDSELRLLFPDGRMKWILNRMIPTYESDQLVMLRGINLDITERKIAEESMLQLNAELERKVSERTNEIRKREEEYHLLLETMREGVLYVDNSDSIVFANLNFCNMMGYTLEQLIGQNASDLFLVPGDKEKMLNVNAQRQNNSKGSYEIQMQKRSGEKIWVHINGSPVVNDAGQIIGSIGTHSDISQLVQNVHKMEEIIFAISHEVRQPVANIIGMAGMLNNVEMNQHELQKIAAYMRESANILDLFTRRLTLLVSENKHLSARNTGVLSAIMDLPNSLKAS